MRPDFARQVDPIFLTATDLLTRIEQNERVVVSDERAKLLRLIDNAEHALGNTEEWQLAKYGLCSWIDSQLIASPWKERDWWTNNSLEFQFWRHGIAHHEFFVRGAQAARLIQKDALEVYYLAVVLGFRGFYNDNDAVQRAAMLNLPPSVEEWCGGVALSLQLCQDRPPLDDSSRVPGSARPLSGRAALINMSMVAVFLVALAIGFFLLFGSQVVDSTAVQVAPPPAVVAATQTFESSRFSPLLTG